ncbi:conserved protein of unknown function [Candidatus Hydrogenisulfobacillus filiaventi]|uniref:Uncharacterized protein n=1 Tax=Candidatus Hydrogenisulfobacillus filiaventi TaxID=2707344 RepID=A0A6F8ZEP8_9FIRM|nr:hypothetical protein [Bacillota bacterium]CAB1128247.1 conserved protein of unknown function [Candidatus Hydrogenisulfobacillus filiaventi]
MPEPLELQNPVPPALRAAVDRLHLTEGQLFGTIPPERLDRDQQQALLQAGWTRRNYADRPVLEPPHAEFDWEALRRRHAEATRAALHTRWPEAAEWGAQAWAIIDEVLASVWEEREEEARSLLAAWSFAALWPAPDPGRPQDRMEGRQVFFFYADSFRRAAEAAAAEITRAPQAEDLFWTLVEAVPKGS